MMKTSKLKKFVFVAVLLFLTGSIFLNRFLYSSLRKYYALLYAVELDPPGLSYFQNSADQRRFDDKLPVVVFFGDSRAAHRIQMDK
jgi:hypothetical protein